MTKEEKREKARVRAAAWRKANPERKRASNAAWAAANPDKTRAAIAAWKKENPDKIRAATAARYAANSDKILAVAAAWKKANPEKVRAASAARYKDKREKIIAINNAWKKSHPEKTRAWLSAWYKAHPEKGSEYCANRRARLNRSEGRHTAEEVKQLLAHQKYRCAVCKKNIKNGYHKDHIVPLSRGGSNYIRNIQLLCPTCNTKKGAKHSIKFMQEQGFLL